MKKNNILPLYVFLISLFLLVGCSSSDDTDFPETSNMMEKPDNPEEPDTSDTVAPKFSLKDTNDLEYSLSSYAGKVVVLFFFGSGCPSCKAVAPKVQNQIANVFSSDKVVLLGLDQWNGNVAAVSSFKSVTNVKFPLLLNASEVAQDYKTTYDRLVIVDKNGNIHFKGTNDTSQDLAQVVGKINGLLN